MNRPLPSDLFEQLSHGFRTNRRFGPVYEHAPASADDLTLIRGIDTREAVILNRLGVYHLAQVALWEPHEAAAFADELGMRVSTLRDEQWIEQARMLCRHRPARQPSVCGHLPASLVRTISLLACALLISCLFIYWLGSRSDQALRGVLSADITSLRVPTESRLTATHVRAGDEVFTGDILLTLEKTEHLAMINLQQGRVRELKRELLRAEAQASLDLEWRLREVDRDLSDVRTRAQLIQEVKRNPVESYRSASTASDQSHPSEIHTTARSVSRSRYYDTALRRPQANSLVFIAASGESSIDVARPMHLPVPLSQPQMVLASEPNAAESVLTVEARSVEGRLQRLEALREVLPEQVQRAAGVESIRVQCDEATKRLHEMTTMSRDVAVICPGHGKVGQVRYRPGDTMAPGEIMLKILHTDRRYVMLNVPTGRLNEIEPGTELELRFPGNAICHGRVTNVPMLAEASLNGQSLATVRVEATGRLWPEIPIGSAIDVVLK